MIAIVFHGIIIVVYGPGDLSKLVFDGKYKVGAREFYTEKHGNEMFVYYPINEQEYYQSNKVDDDITLCKHGKKYSAEMAKNMKSLSNGMPIVANVCYEQTFIMQDVVKNANIAGDF